MTRTSTIALLDRTHQILNQRGLAKHTHHARSGEVCVFGALELARIELDLTHNEGCAAGQALYDANAGNNPAALNDLNGTTVDDMLYLVETAKACV